METYYDEFCKRYKERTGKSAPLDSDAVEVIMDMLTQLFEATIDGNRVRDFKISALADRVRILNDRTIGLGKC